MAKRERPKRWSFSAGSRPNTVRVYERKRGGNVYARAWDPSKRGGEGDWVKKSLGYAVRAEDGDLIEEATDRAEAYAMKHAAKLKEGNDDLRAGRVTLATVLSAYERHRTPRKSDREQRADARRSEMWARWLGGETNPHAISLRDWEGFIDARSSGAIDARGNRVPDEENWRPVRARTVEADCDWLRWVFNWAAKWRTPKGRYLLTENPIRGFESPTEENPRRPVATRDRYEALRKHTDRVTMEVRWNGKREERRSYVSELLDLAAGTGRRISAICGLRYRDLRLERTDTRPYGAIRWPADTDKTNRESTVPVGPGVRAALDRVMEERPGIGDAPLFPSPEDPETPISRHLADSWLREAEKLAGVEPMKGSLWHAYRRMWATARKGLPAQDVAAAGGWASAETVSTIYQQADEETTLQVVLHEAEVRERQG